MEKKLGKMFLKASLLYFGISIIIGVIMVIIPIYGFVVMSSLFEIAYTHLVLIGLVSFAMIGLIYLVLGRTNKLLYSEKLGNMGFGLLNIGIFIEFTTLFAGGYSQAYAYMTGDPNAYAIHIPYTMFATIFDAVMIIGACMTIYNIYKTSKT